jgi:hypothetical protein
MQVNLQPTNDVLERKFADPKRGEFSVRKCSTKVGFLIIIHCHSHDPRSNVSFLW